METVNNILEKIEKYNGNVVNTSRIKSNKEEDLVNNSEYYCGIVTNYLIASDINPFFINQLDAALKPNSFQWKKLQSFLICKNNFVRFFGWCVIESCFISYYHTLSATLSYSAATTVLSESEKITNGFSGY